MTQKTKVCNSCKRRRRADKFRPYVRKDRKDALAPRCIECSLREDRERRRLKKQAKDAGMPIVNFVPAEPFRGWVRDVVGRRYESITEFCLQCDVEDRRMRDILNGKSKRVSLDTVDRALTNDGQTMLWEIYPELYP